MKLAARLAVVLVLAVPGAVGAQSSPQTDLPAHVGDNANIIPIYQSSDPPAADDYLRGNLLGQRCNEASIGISSLNPDHMMVFCNDYRATFNWDDSLVPSGKDTLLAAVWSEVQTFWAWLTDGPRPEPEPRKIIASAEAGIGGGFTYDGITWQGFMVPGGPHDNTPASLAHPGKQLGLQGYSDPFAINMEDGRVGVVYIGFTRDKVSGEHTQSAVFFTRYRDRNASDHLNDWVYEFTSMVALSNNLKQGQFLDKVSGAVGPDGRLYVAFTRFTGNGGSANIYLAQSGTGGLTWDAASIDKDAKYGQAALPLVNPTDASEVGVLWRTFVDNGLLFKSTRKGTKNVDLFENDSDGPYLPFDQYSQAVDLGDPLEGGNRVAFRTLAFPAADYTPDGTHLVAVFTEWTDLDTGAPGTAGYPMPMVVMKVSTDGGATWSPRYVLNVENDEWERGVPASPERLGFFSPAREVGAQFQPGVSCTVGNQCLVVWKQSYESSLSQGGSENPGSLVMAGLTRRFDVRGALVTFNGAVPSVSPSFQVSRYGYRELGPNDRPEDVMDSEGWIAKMALPNGTTYPIVNYDNRNHSGAGRVAFTGDYIGVEEVRDGEFMVAFSDNRYNIWPWQTELRGDVPIGQEWRYYPVFQAPDDPENPGISCVNYGSRVQSVMAARVTTSGLLLSAPTSRKPFDGAEPVCGGAAETPCIEFPLNVRNNTGLERTVHLTVASDSCDTSTCPSFAKRPFDAALDEGSEYMYPLETGDVTIYPYSSYSLNVYAFDDSPVTVTASADGDVATYTFNDPTVAAASASNPDFTYVPSTVNIESGSARSGSARSGSARSGSARSGSARSYPVPEDPVPGETVYDVIDYTYVVTPNSQDDAGTYLSLFNIDPAYEGSYVFQVFVTKPLTSFMTDADDTCAAFNWTEGALIGHISDPENPLVSGSARSGSARSGSARSGSARSAIPSDGDTLVQNTSFTLGSSTETVVNGTLEASSTFMAATSSLATGAAENCLIDECTLAPPRLPNEVTILVRAYQIAENPPVEYNPHGEGNRPATPPSVAVAEYSCDDPSCTAALGPDLVVQNLPAPPLEPALRVKAGEAVPFPEITLTNEGVSSECGTPDEPLPCGDGDARSHEWAVYASTEEDFNFVPRWDCSVDTCNGQISGTVKEIDKPGTDAVVTVLLASDDHDELGVGETETAAVGDVTIPASLPRTNSDGTGTYYLHFYDDRGRIVNELDETNNHWTMGPIIVESAGYGFLGLQTPCDGQTCDKTGAVVLAWQFTDGSVPVDSGDTLPRLAFYADCPGLPIGEPLASSAPDPTNTTTGSSGWQYFPDPGMSRPQYTWQFNFDATGLTRGSCYSMYVEVPDTGQVIGSTEEGLEPFGPFFITPR